MGKKNVLITGTSSGLGLSLCDIFLENDYSVYGISRSKTPRNIHSTISDFSNRHHIVSSIASLVRNNNFEYVFLNAGVLEPIKKAKDISLEEFENSFQINVTASKQILDFLLKNTNGIKNVIAISSGAANKVYDGWLTYCVTKSAMKQMISCYALENPGIHFLSLAPGIIKTKMQDYILSKDVDEFKSLEKFHEIYDCLPGPDEISRKIFSNLGFLSSLDSGSFFDLREK